MTFSGKSLVMVVVLFLILFAGAGCSKKMDVVNGIPPVHGATAVQRATIDSLRGKNPEQIMVILKRDWPDLAGGIIANLRSDGKIKPAEKISKHSFFYGSADATGESKGGKRYAGRFDDQLIMRIAVVGRSKPIEVAVLCTNGMFDLKNSNLKEVGSMRSRFVIKKGKSLVDYVGYVNSIQLASHNNLPIIMGRGASAKRITAQQALRTDTDRHLVRVPVFPGDRGDLADMSFRRAK